MARAGMAMAMRRTAVRTRADMATMAMSMVMQPRSRRRLHLEPLS